MVKFDIAVFKFLTRDHFRVLTAIEMGMKNHAIVPTSLIEALAQMKRGNCFKIITDLHKHKLVTHNSLPYDGYTLTFRGYDYLAINVFVKRGLIIAIGRQIGVGKESDVFEAFGPKDPATDISPKYVLKLHRLGRISFRTVKNKRDYLRNNKYNTASKGSWLYLSRLSALKEYGFMKILHQKEFPVPQPLDVCRHAVLMSYISGFPLYHAKKIKKPAILCSKSLSLIVKLAQYGLIHCDFNEFNLMVNDNYDLYVIDFPQMISINHKQGIEYFNRDVQCIVHFFASKHNFEVPPDEIPIIDESFLHNDIIDHLDNVIEASGYYGKNEQIHKEDFDTLHSFFSSTIELQGNNGAEQQQEEHDDAGDGNQEQDQDENDGDGDEKEEDEEEEEDVDEEALKEKEEWKLKKLQKKQEFQKRKLLKKAVMEHREQTLHEQEHGDEDRKESGNGEDGKDGIRTLSEAEIRRRIKKKQKQELRKTRYKKAKKTNDQNKARRAMKAEMTTNFW